MPMRYAVLYSDDSRVEYADKPTAAKCFDVFLRAFVDWPDEVIKMVEIGEGGDILLAEKRVGEAFARVYPEG